MFSRFSRGERPQGLGKGKYSRRQSPESIVAELRRAPVGGRIRFRNAAIATAATIYSFRVHAAHA
jgi:hypothetical protein